ncbi:hypothetical protein CPB85DRAFT_1507778 [Mucidula mucida]|nr:hypothetical protein CPB85DRAFT_1447736 [Mucidula mucida]KAF8912566.1 hypothetical protein CPB85DRAFT_1507778 [Mucidula mucida]
MLPPLPYHSQNLNGPRTFAVTTIYNVASTFTSTPPVANMPSARQTIVYLRPAVSAPGPLASRTNSPPASGSSSRRFNPYRIPQTPRKVTPEAKRQLAPRYAAASSSFTESVQRATSMLSPTTTPEPIVNFPSSEPVDLSVSPAPEPAIDLSFFPTDEEWMSILALAEPVPMTLTPPSSPGCCSPLTALSATDVSTEIHADVEALEMRESLAEQIELNASAEIMTSSEETKIFDSMINDGIFP